MQNLESSPIVADCEFSNNTAEYGGAMANGLAFAPDVLDCTFTDNAAGVHGGAILNEGPLSPFVSRCSFVGNTADMGGAIANVSSDTATRTARIVGCLFSANRASLGSGAGGGIYNSSTWPYLALIDNCTLVGNSAGTGGGVASSGSGDACTVTNCILYGNRASTGPEAWGSSCEVSFSRISQAGGYTAQIIDRQENFPGANSATEGRTRLH